LLARANELLAANQPGGVPALLEPVLASPFHREQALLLIANSHARQDQLTQAQTYLDEIDADGPLATSADALRTRIELTMASAALDETQSRQRVASDPDDAHARWALAGHLLQNHQHAEALETLLQLLTRDRSFRDDGARRGMLAIFECLGADDPLVREYRRRLQIYL
jgi:putative thioredoxin